MSQPQARPGRADPHAVAPASAAQDQGGAHPERSPEVQRASSGRRGALRERAWLIFLAIGSALVGLYYLLPGRAIQSVLFDSLSLTAGFAIFFGVRLNRPARAGPWYLLALAQLFFFGGDLTWNIYEVVLEEAPFPSAADILYLAGYPAAGAGLLLFVRSRVPGGHRASLIDAAIIATGLGVISWILLVDPYLADPELTPLELIISIACPLADVLLLGPRASSSIRVVTSFTASSQAGWPAYGSPWTTSEWATHRFRTSGAFRSTSSRSTARSLRRWAPAAPERR